MDRHHEQTEPGENSHGIAPELLAYLDPEKLAENRGNFEEFGVKLSPEGERRLQIIEEVLLQLPLNHGSRHEIDSLVPARDLPSDHSTHTYILDQSLGLDRYTFLHWGVPEWSIYGRNIFLFDARILLDPKTIVTTYDIGQGGLADESAFEDLDPETRERLQGYFDHALSGSDWLELQARRILIDYREAKKRHLDSGKTMEDFHYHYVIDSPAALGEVKHLGRLDGDSIIGRTSKSQWKDYYKDLYSLGLAYNNVEWARKDRLSVDPTPEDCGVDYEKSGRFWIEKLELRK